MAKSTEEKEAARVAKEQAKEVARAEKEAATTEALRLQAVEKEVTARHEAELAALALANAPVPEVPGREKRWKEHLAKYEQTNPVKFAAKKENGEFAKIPNSFA